jgi:hypothetical protein
MSAETSDTGIIERTEFPRWNPLLWVNRTRISVEGVTTKRLWGDTYIPVDPGSHELCVWAYGTNPFAPTFFGLRTVTVHIVAGSTTVVRYRSPWSPLLGGRGQIYPDSATDE